MDSFIVDYSEIPTSSSFVIEFIIPKIFEGSACFEPLPWQQLVTTWAVKLEAANTV
jgi:hypothetical protein